MKIKKALLRVKKNILLKNYTSFKIGGKAKYFYKAKSRDDLIKGILFSKKTKLPFFILGGGSKLLVADKGYGGLVIKIKMSKLKYQIKSKIPMSRIYAEAGVSLALMVSRAERNNLAGLEWAVGIPGTVGGAIRGNAGAFGGSMADMVKEVEVFNVKTEKIEKLSNIECKFDYRESIFKSHKNLIILSAVLQLKKDSKRKIKEKMKKHLDYRKRTQPFKFPSAGSIFKNPPGFSAGKLIEECGLKGTRIGDVEISEKHANFIVNLGKGQAKDVIKLIGLIQKEVKNKFNIILEEEIQHLGF